MMTWEIMIGAQLISILASAGVVISFMLKKEPLDVVEVESIPVMEGTLTHGTVQEKCL